MWKKWSAIWVVGVLLLPGANAVHAREIAGQSFGGKGWSQSDSRHPSRSPFLSRG